MAVPNFPTFGCTDETFGYFQNLRVRATSEKRLGFAGDGTIKYRNSFGKRSIVEGEYVYVADDSTVSGKVGTDTALTITDGDSPGNIYVDEYEITKTGGENPDGKVCRFVGEYYPDLAS